MIKNNTDRLGEVRSYLDKFFSKKKLIDLLLERINWTDLSMSITIQFQEELDREMEMIDKANNTKERMKRIVGMVGRTKKRWESKERALAEIDRKAEE